MKVYLLSVFYDHFLFIYAFVSFMIIFFLSGTEYVFGENSSEICNFIFKHILSKTFLDYFFEEDKLCRSY